MNRDEARIPWAMDAKFIVSNREAFRAVLIFLLIACSSSLIVMKHLVAFLSILGTRDFDLVKVVNNLLVTVVVWIVRKYGT